MGDFLENLYDILFQPLQGMKSIAARRLTGQAVVALLLSVLIPAWPIYFFLKEINMPILIHLIIIVQILGSFILWFVGVAILHLIAEMAGGRGTAAGLLAAMGFSHVPRIFLVPGWVVTILMPAGIRPLLFAVLGIMTAVWTLGLAMVAIRANYDFSPSKAIVVLITPLLALIAAFLVIAILLGAALIPFPCRFG